MLIYSENFTADHLPDMVNISNAYVIQDGVVSAVWAFSEGYDLLNMVMIDVATGERVNIY